MRSARESLPLDIFHRILHFIPSTETNTLASLLRLNKTYSYAVAPKLYSKLRITPDIDVCVDMGLPASPEDARAIGTSSLGDSNMVSDDQARDGTAGKPDEKERGSGSLGNSTSLANGRTLKAYCLSLIRTIDILPYSDPSQAIQVNEHFQRQRQKFHPCPIPHLDQITLHLDTTTPSRPSPLARAVELSTSLYLPCMALLEKVRCARLVITGASFMMTADPMLYLPRSIVANIQKVVIIITPGAPVTATWSDDYGLTMIYHNLVGSAVTLEPTMAILSPSTITFVIQTPKPTTKFKVVRRPHRSMAMTMEYHPDYAPGYLNPLTLLLAEEISADWKRTINRDARQRRGQQQARRRKVNFVNFGSLDGEEMGMPQAAQGEMEDRFRKGINIRMTQNVSRMRIFEGMDVGDTWKEDVRVIGMKEWLEEDKKRRDVLDNDILKGWS